MTEQIELLHHLASEPVSIQGRTVFSGFTAALRDARGATGRDPATGAIVNPEHTCSWLGAVGYLILLDQIGTCFRPAGTADVDGNTINHALSYFTDFSGADRIALYALRCTLAHDYSLVNEHPRTHRRTHHFIILSDPDFPVLRHPPQPWNGDYASQEPDNATIVNIRAMGELVEKIYRELLDLAKAGNLKIILPGGMSELTSRYGISFQTPIIGRSIG